jgi:hypothetical protein
MGFSQERLHELVLCAREIIDAHLAEWHYIEKLNQDLAYGVIKADKYIQTIYEMAADPAKNMLPQIARIEREELEYNLTHKRNEAEARRKRYQRQVMGLPERLAWQKEKLKQSKLKELQETARVKLAMASPVLAKQTELEAAAKAMARDDGEAKTPHQRKLDAIDEANKPDFSANLADELANESPADLEERVNKGLGIEKPKGPYDKRGLA